MKICDQCNTEFDEDEVWHAIIKIGDKEFWFDSMECFQKWSTEEYK